MEDTDHLGQQHRCDFVPCPSRGTAAPVPGADGMGSPEAGEMAMALQGPRPVGGRGVTHISRVGRKRAL